MKYLFITFFLLNAFSACSPKKKEKRQKNQLTNEIQNLSFPLYIRTDSTIKILEQKKTESDIKITTINYSKPEVNKQSIRESKKEPLKNIYSNKWAPEKRKIETHFLQIQPKTNEIENVLSIQNYVNNNITKAIIAKNLGQYAASDLGVGGVNFLFEVSNQEAFFSELQSLIKQANLSENSIIAKRIYIKQGNWTYKVLDPINFEATFYSM